ncbi:hypothetical protein SCP_0300220 [Sparassis crispa]|uniref:Reverse transcriptase zinc-binding domain-containing protein n=1 Tax=Sparassis crispa TaxID=139825 RepID=A0A401GDR9_9APHY|nr:hypothetical protein SCP_0300220 [Sparassis crispa]GBE80307.1 hypothetical protein SCP_0300220 [Sparassis crispa]
MDDYVLFSSSDGYIESDPSTYLSHALVAAVVDDRSFTPLRTLALPFYNDLPPPDYPYTRASSAYSALVQLYARCGQLDTAYTRFARFGDSSLWCQFGCYALETPHHLFVECPMFAPLRENARRDVITESSKLLLGAETTPSLMEDILLVARSLFIDSDVWPLYTSHYFLGILPPTPTQGAPATSTHRRLCVRLMQTWHTIGIRLAGRIWGEYKRRTHPHTRRTFSPPQLSLPLHLAHLLPSS